MYLTRDANFQQVAGITAQTCELPYLSSGSGADTCYQPEITIRAEHDKAESSRDTSAFASDDSDDVGVIENFPIGNEAGSSEEDKRDEKNFSSMENLGSLTEMTGSATTSDLPHTNMMSDSTKNGVFHLHQISDAVDEKVTSDDVHTVDEFCEEQATKRRRLIPLECGSDSLGILTKESC